MKKNPGFILVLTLLILSLATIIVTKLFVQARTYTAFSMITTKREQARHLAQSGVALALAQLTLHDTKLKPKDEKQDKEKPNEKQAVEKQARQLLKTLLLVQNKWQTFVLTHDQDGIDAIIHICITCEDGKINLNKIWNFKTHAFSNTLLKTQDPKKLFGMLGETAAPFTNNKNMFEGVVDVLKKQPQPLFDITQLLTSTKLWDFKDHVFFEPPFEQPKEASKSSSEFMPMVQDKVKDAIALTDLFTVWTDESTMYPLLLSTSMRLIFKLPAHAPNTKEFAQEVDTLVEKIPLDGVNWMQDWNTYAKPVLQKEFAVLPKEILPFLGSKFEPRIFSVLCYAEVGTVKQKLLAILERSRVEKGEEFKVKKLYWI